jgi:signal transduction histidine kinase
MREGMILGADDYLTKPFEIDELLDAVNVRLDRQAAHEEETEEKLNELRSNIILILPHEVRTPLVGLMGYADYLIDHLSELETEEISEMLKRIKKGGQRLYHLVENYLLYAQIEMLKTDKTTQEGLNEYYISMPKETIAQHASYAARNAKREKDLILTLSGAVEVQIAEESFAKIIEELFDNAFKFSKPNTPVTISAAPEANFYVLRVSDCGRGMTEKEIENIGAYMQFRRRLYEQQGSGMGLCLVRGLVDIFGGELDIQSVLGEKTTVTVKLPLKPA